MKTPSYSQASLLIAAILAVTPDLRAQDPLFFEDFEELELGPNVDEGVPGEMVWTNTPPTDWVIDNSKLFGVDDEGVGVTEWKGWAFADKDWWTETAGDQGRVEFLSGTGTVAIADPDEWDDIGGPGAQGRFETYMSTPPISLADTAAETAVLSFDSSWRPEFDDNYHQSANLTVSFDGGAPIELFRWLSDDSSPDFKAEAIDEKVIVPLSNPEGAGEMVITFGMFDAGNDWWWAIDNIEVATGAVLSKVRGRRSSVLLEITDTGISKIDQSTVTLQIDGKVAPADVTKENEVVRIIHNPAPPYASGSLHTYLIDAKDIAGTAVQFSGEFEVPVPALPEDPLPGAEFGEGEFGVRYIYGGFAMNNVANAVAAIQAVADGSWEGGFFDTGHAYINHGDGNGLFIPDDDYPEEVLSDEDGLWTDEEFIQFARGTIRVPESGEYTFGAQTDDGFALRILGAEFSSVVGQGNIDPGDASTMIHAGTTGNSSSRGVVMLAAGDYDIEFLWFEHGGGDFGELYVAKGAFGSDGETDTWQIVGKPKDGEAPLLTLVAEPRETPQVRSIEIVDNSINITFTTPDPEGTHELQSSQTLANWGSVETATMTDAGNGEFQFSTALGAQPEAYYRIGLLPPPPVLFADFENGEEGWEAETNNDTAWEIGTPAVADLNAAFSGAGAWGTNLDGDYGDNTLATLRSPLVDLTDVIRPKLSFQYYMDSVVNIEGGQIRFINEGGDILFTRQEIFSGKTDAWTEFSTSLPKEVREAGKIRIEFRFLSDGDGTVGAGWYIDDVQIK